MKYQGKGAAFKGAIYYVTITTVISSRVKITCYLHVWRYEVFAGKLTWYFTGVYIISQIKLLCLGSVQITKQMKQNGEQKKERRTTNPACMSSFVKLPAPSPNSWRYIQSCRSREQELSQQKHSLNTTHYLTNRKHVPCFYRVIDTRVEVWAKCCGNTSCRWVFQCCHHFNTVISVSIDRFHCHAIKK